MAFQRSPHFCKEVLSGGFSIAQSCVCVNPAFVVTYLPVSAFAPTIVCVGVCLLENITVGDS